MINDADSQTLPPLLEARQIERRSAKGEPLLQDVSIQIDAGQRWAVVGKSGSGKSLLLRSLCLLDPIDAGAIYWQGQTIANDNVPAFRRRVIYLHQRPVLLPGTVEGNLRQPYEVGRHQQSGGEQGRFDREKVLELLADLSRAADFLQKDAGNLSGGEGQLVALLRAIQLQPTILLLDEPTGALDSAAAAAVELLVDVWHNERKDERAVVWVSHDESQISRVADRRLTLSDGRIGNTALAPSPDQVE